MRSDGRHLWRVILCVAALLVQSACASATAAPPAATESSVVATVPPASATAPIETAAEPIPTSTVRVEEATATNAPAEHATPEPVAFTTEDGIELAGTLYGAGETVVLLANMQGAAQPTWQAFAQTVAEAGYAAFTFDYRGRGKSDGESDDLTVAADAKAAIDYVRDQGFDKIVLIGASLGGIAVARNSHEPNVTGLALVSAPRGYLELVIPDDNLVYLGYPKLFVVAEENEPFFTDMQAMYALVAPPKGMKVFTGGVHGTDLFKSEHGAEFESLLLDFIGEAAAGG